MIDTPLGFTTADTGGERATDNIVMPEAALNSAFMDWDDTSRAGVSAADASL